MLSAKFDRKRIKSEAKLPVPFFSPTILPVHVSRRGEPEHHLLGLFPAADLTSYVSQYDRQKFHFCSLNLRPATVSSQEHHFILDVLLLLVVVSGQALETPACRAHAVYKNTEEPESERIATNGVATPRIS